MRLATTDMRELVAEDQHTAAQFFQPLRHGGNSEGNQRSQFLNFSFQIPQQRIVRLNLTVDLTAVRDNTLLLQSTGNYTLVNGGLLIQPSGGVAAVVNAFRKTGTFQIAVGHVCPCCPPRKKLFQRS